MRRFLLILWLRLAIFLRLPGNYRRRYSAMHRKPRNVVAPVLGTDDHAEVNP